MGNTELTSSSVEFHPLTAQDEGEVERKGKLKRGREGERERERERDWLQGCRHESPAFLNYIVQRDVKRCQMPTEADLS